MIAEVRYIGLVSIEPQSTDDFFEHSMVPGTHQFMFLGVVKGLSAVLRLGSALVACGLLLIVVSGCDRGPERVPVSGRVLVDGEPLTTGTIRFVPESGRPASAQISADGSFRVVTKSLAGNGAEVVGLVPGSYRMAVLASESLGEAEDAEVRWLVPRHYGDFRTSGLEVDIQAATEKMGVELTWEGVEETDEEAETEEGDVSEENPETLERQEDKG